MEVYFKGVKSSYGLTPPLPHLNEFTVLVAFKTNYASYYSGDSSRIWRDPTIITCTNRGATPGQIHFGIGNGYLSYEDLSSSFRTNVFVADNKFHVVVLIQKSNKSKIYLDGKIVMPEFNSASNKFGHSMYIGCDNTFSDDFYANPNKITIRRVHFYLKAIDEKDFFNVNIKNQAFCYCNYAIKENGQIKLKDTSGNNNDILCYNCDLIPNISYSNLKIKG